MERLADQKCVACRRDAPRATREEIDGWLPEIPEWSIVDQDGVPKLVRSFRFDDFAGALAFTDAVGALAEEENHHPALLTEWGCVTVSWWTHKIKGLHRNDFVMAARTDALHASR